MNEHFDLENSCLVKLRGSGGRTVERLMRYDLRATRATKPDILVLEIGRSNDLCDPSADPETIGETITAFIMCCIHSYMPSDSMPESPLPELQSESPKAKQVTAGHVGRFSPCKILAPSRTQQPHKGHLCL